MSTSTHIVSLIFTIICLIIILFIGTVSIKQLSSLTKLQPIFKYLFHIAWTASLIELILFITTISHCSLATTTDTVFYHGQLAHSGYLFYILLSLIILLTLLLRLYFAFNNSMYAISKTIKCILGALYCIAVAIFMYVIIIFIIRSVELIKYNRAMYVPVMFTVNRILAPIYILTTIITIVIFGKKMMILTDTRATSIYINDSDTDVPQLNAYQIKMIENTTRYVSLLTFGIFSSFSVMIVIILFNFVWSYDYYDEISIIFIILSVDSVINIMCLYLQYSFSRSYYEKYCKYLHLLWRCLLTRQATHSLMKQYDKSMNEAKQNENDKENIALIVVNE